MSNSITLGCTHEITVGKHRAKAWPKAEVTIEVLADETPEDHLARTRAELDKALNVVVEDTVQRIMDNE